MDTQENVTETLTEYSEKVAGHAATLFRLPLQTETAKRWFASIAPTTPNPPPDILIKLTQEQEALFYEFVNASSSDYSASFLSSWIPPYYGRVSILELRSLGFSTTVIEGAIAIAIGNVLPPLQSSYPKQYISGSYRLTDIKLGTILYDITSASPEKRARMEQVSSSSTSGSLGFRICGMRIPGENTRIRDDSIAQSEDWELEKEEGKRADKDQVLQWLGMFTRQDCALSCVIASQIKALRDAITQAHVDAHLIGASLLIAVSPSSGAFLVKLIDFAHSSIQTRKSMVSDPSQSSLPSEKMEDSLTRLNEQRLHRLQVREGVLLGLGNLAELFDQLSHKRVEN